MNSEISLNEALAQIDLLKKENKDLRSKLRSESAQKRKSVKLNEQLKLIIDSSGLGTWEYDYKTGRIQINDTWTNQLGYSQEEIGTILENIIKLVNPSDLNKLKESFSKNLQGIKSSFDAELRIKTKDGNLKWMLTSGKIFSRDKLGNPLKIIGSNLDITHLKEYERKLRDREKQYKALFDYAPIGLWEQDITELEKYIKQLKKQGIKNFKKYFDDYPKELENCITKIVPMKINKAALSIHDAKSLKEIKKNFNKIFTQRSKAVFKDQIIDYAKGNKYFESETETFSLKGKHRKLKININYKRLPVKNRHVILFSLYDITKQKAAEKALIDSEERYKTLFQISPTGILLESSDGKILDANPAVHESFGYEMNELIGKNIKILAHPQMRSNIKENIKTILGGITLKHIVKGIKKDGTLIYNELYETKVSLSKIGDTVLCLSNDITQQIITENRLKENERYYRSLFYNNPLPMYIFEKETYKFLDINEAAINKYGYSKSELSKMTILDIRPKKEIDRVVQDIANLTNGLEKRGVWKHKKKNGDVFFVDITAYSIDYFGKYAELVLANDITEKILAEKELEKSQNQIREFAKYLESIREEERNNIAREIHDNLGQSLTAIKLDLSWIESHCRKEDNRFHNKIKLAKSQVDNSIETIQKISTSLRPRIIDDLGLTASLEWFIDDFKERTLIDCSLNINPKNLTFDIELSTNIFRIVQEALTNVIRHAEATKVTISLLMKKNKIKLAIIDNGKGISKEEINRHNSFGLIGIKERVIKYDGDLSIKGVKNKGTEIKITIPITDNEL